MSEVRFTVEHEWLRLDHDGLVTVGVTEYAQDALGDVVYVQLPELGQYARGAEVAVLESVKAASNITMPLDGELVEINSNLEANPEMVNESPEQDGWFFRMRLADEASLQELMTEEAYKRLLTAKADA